MKKNDLLYVNHIWEAITRLEEYFSGVEDDEQLLDDKMRFDAIVRNFEIIGEATKHLSEEFLQENNTIDWSLIVGMRNILAHEYHEVDAEILFNTFKDDLPELKKIILPYINKSI